MRRRRNLRHALWAVVAAAVSSVPALDPAGIREWLTVQFPVLPSWGLYLLSAGILGWRALVIVRAAEEQS